MKKHIEGTGITAFFYIIVLMIGYLIDTRMLGEKMEVSGVFIGSLTMTIPYILLGLFLSESYDKKSSLKEVFTIGFFVVVAERIVIYLAGFTYILRDVGPNEPNWAVGLPYFTSFYITICGILSVVICVSVSGVFSNIVKIKGVT